MYGHTRTIASTNHAAFGWQTEDPFGARRDHGICSEHAFRQLLELTPNTMPRLVTVEEERNNIPLSSASRVDAELSGRTMTLGDHRRAWHPGEGSRLFFLCSEGDVNYFALIARDKTETVLIQDRYSLSVATYRQITSRVLGILAARDFDRYL